MSQERDELEGGLKRIAAALKAAPPRPLPANFARQLVDEVLKRRERRSRWVELLCRPFVFLFLPQQVVRRPVWQVAWGLVLCVLSSLATMWFWEVFPMSREGAEQVWVRFAVQAPGAHQVTLAGDFNAWDIHGIRLEDPEGKGIWHVVVPLEPGLYQYMFILDGEQWVPDPLGNETVEDGFGQRNSLVRVLGSGPERRGEQESL